MATYTGLKSILQEFLHRALPSGIIMPYVGSSAPKGYLLCDGSAVSRTDYARLFSAIGTAYGEGDGSTTFNLPDLRETVPVGAGTRGSGVTSHDSYELGTFKDDQMESHTHSFSWSGSHNHGIASWVKNNSSPDGGQDYHNKNDYGYVTTRTDRIWYDNTTYHTPKSEFISNKTINVNGTTGSSGGGNTTHGKQLGVNYIIKY